MLLTLKNISKAYNPKSEHAKRQVLNNLNLEVEKGQSIAIIGPSGSGKTTLLNIIGTLDKADSGEVIFNDKIISKFNIKELVNFRNQQIGFVFQLHHLLPQCTLLENVLIPTLPVKNKSLNFQERAEILLKKTGIWEQRNQKPGELSGGECQRAAVVRALINKPELILADEPTGALDEENANLLTGLLINFNKNENTTLIVVTHSTEIARKMDKIYKLKNGKLELI